MCRSLLPPTALNSTYLECAGDPSEEYYKDFSLVITRDSIYEDTGRLTYVPSRMLQGIDLLLAS